MGDTSGTNAPRFVGLPQVLMVAGGISMTLTLLTAILSSYHGHLFTESLSFFINDGWCDYKTQGIGIHCFGDFGTWRNVTLSVDTFTGILATGHPAVLLLGLPYQLLPYSIGALANSFLLAAATLAPLALASRPLRITDRLNLIVTLGIWNVGFIATFDRGNHIGFVVLFLYLYLDSIRNENYGKATIYLAILSCLKWWGVLFVIPLLALKMWRCIAKAGILSLVVTYVSLGFFPGSIAFKVEKIWTAVTSRQIGASASAFSVSGSTLLVRISCVLRSEKVCDPSASWANGGPATAGKIALLVILLSLLWYLVRKAKPISDTGLALTPLIGIVAIPEAQMYNISLIIVTTALLIQIDFPEPSSPRSSTVSGSLTNLHRFLGVVAVIISAPIAFRLTHQTPLGVFTGLTHEFRIQYLTVPAAGFIMIVVTTSWVIARRSSFQRLRSGSAQYPKDPSPPVAHQRFRED